MNLFQINWFTLTIISVICYAATNVIQKAAINGEEVNPSSFSAYFQILAGVLTIPISITDFEHFTDNPAIWGLIFVVVIIFFWTNLLYFYSLKEIQVSEASILQSTRAIWFMLGGLIFFQEAITPSKFLGTLLIFLGLFVVYWGKNGFRKFGISHFYMLAFAVLFSLANILSKYILNYVSPAALQTITFTLTGILNMFLVPGTLKNMKPLIRLNKYNLFIIISALTCALGSLTNYMAYQTAEISKIGPISQTSIILTVILGIFVLKEKDGLRKKILAAVIAFLGVILIRAF